MLVTLLEIVTATNAVHALKASGPYFDDVNCDYENNNGNNSFSSDRNNNTSDNILKYLRWCNGCYQVNNSKQNV